MKQARLELAGIVALLLGALPAAAHPAPIDLTPRSPLEAVVLGEANAARTHLQALALQAREERGPVIAELLAAGFEPDRGMPGCDFYGYHRRTTEQGAARSVQVALCASGDPMVLVMDMLPPDRRGGGMSELRKGNEQ